MTQQFSYFPCRMVMVHDKFFMVIQAVIHNKTFSAAKSALEFLFYFDGFKCILGNAVVTNVIRVAASTYRGTIMLRRCFWNKCPSAPSAYFRFEITVRVFVFLF